MTLVDSWTISMNKQQAVSRAETTQAREACQKWKVLFSYPLIKESRPKGKRPV